MKRILVGLGALLVLALLSIWVYLLLFGAPGEVSERVGLGVETATTERPVVAPDTEAQIALDGSLQQLTTRPVAGFTLLKSSTSRAIRYAERGTGHVYEIDLVSGTETKVSGVTTAEVIEAVFNADGSWVAVTAEEGDQEKVSLLSLIDPSLNTSHDVLPDNSHSAFFIENNLLRYLTKEAAGSVIYEQDLTTEVTALIATMPLLDVTAHWTDSALLVANRPAPMFLGNLYRLEEAGLSSWHEPAYAYTAVVSQDGRQALESYYDFDEEVMVSVHLDLTTGAQQTFPLVAMPGKCGFSDQAQAVIWCASSLDLGGITDRNYLTDWYKGLIRNSDALWKIDLDTGEAELVIDLYEQAGFAIDVDNLYSAAGEILFTNKLNDTLWRYTTENTL